MRKNLLILAVLTAAICFRSNFAHSQIPTTCFEIQSIFADACGSNEGQNEMVRFIIGPTAMNVSNLTVSWPSNSFKGISAVNATTNSNVAILNASILGCGFIKQPVAGVLPPGSKVILVGSTAMNPASNSFANLNDTIYMIFQNAGNTAGHFLNYSGTTAIRTLSMTFTGFCSDVVSYDAHLLITPAGTPGSADGATIVYDFPGNPTYVNFGNCQAPFIPLESVLTASANPVCPGTQIQVTATITSGSYASVYWFGGQGVYGNTTALTTSYQTNNSYTGTDNLYFGIITDCNDTLFDTLKVQINNGVPVSITPGGLTTFCQGDSVTLTAIGTGTFLWSTGATTNAITVKTAANYAVTLTGVCGVSNDAELVIVNLPPSAKIDTSGITTFCSGGSVTLTASDISGSSLTPSYLWSTGATTAAINANSTLNYVVTISNSCGTASVNQQVTVNSSVAVSILSSGGNVICQNDSLTLTAIGTGTFLWSTGATTNSIIVKTPANYAVTLTAICGVTNAVLPITVNLPPTAKIDTSGITTFCSGGAVTLTASDISGATGTPTYLWSTGATTSSISVNSTLNCIVTITNSCGSSSVSQQVTVNTSIPVTISTSGNTTICQGDSVTLTASGTGIFLWSNGSTSNAITVKNAAIYTVTLTAICGISNDSKQVTVNIPPVSKIDTSGVTTFCQGNNVTLTASDISGAVVVPTYLWSTGATTASINVTNSGSFIVTVSNNCGTSTSQQAVLVNPLPFVSIITTGITSYCSGTPTTLTASGNGTFLWSTGSTTSSILFSTGTLFTVTVTNICGSTSTTKVLAETFPPVLTITGGTTVLCPGTSETLTASGGDTYSWSTGDISTSINVSTGGWYAVTATNACGSDMDSVLVTASNISATFIADITTGEAPLTIKFTAINQNAASYTWNFGDGKSSTDTNPTHVFLKDSTYVVELRVTDDNGCADVFSLTIVVKTDSAAYVPNVFTPNDDQINDIFNIVGYNMTSFNASVYNRWGNEISSWTQEQVGWDGKKDGTEVPAGVYYYIIKVNFKDGSNKSFRGAVTLVR